MNVTTTQLSEDLLPLGGKKSQLQFRGGIVFAVVYKLNAPIDPNNPDKGRHSETITKRSRWGRAYYHLNFWFCFRLLKCIRGVAFYY
jgi:hypothetical protein